MLSTDLYFLCVVGKVVRKSDFITVVLQHLWANRHELLGAATVDIYAGPSFTHDISHTQQRDYKVIFHTTQNDNEDIFHTEQNDYEGIFHTAQNDHEGIFHTEQTNMRTSFTQPKMTMRVFFTQNRLT